ncbi:FixH family protein [Undibacterium arcticum]
MQGKTINQDLRRDRVATRLGLSFNGRYDAATGKLQGTLLSFGVPTAGKIRIHLAHATQPEKKISNLKHNPISAANSASNCRCWKGHAGRYWLRVNGATGA